MEELIIGESGVFLVDGSSMTVDRALREAGLLMDASVEVFSILCFPFFRFTNLCDLPNIIRSYHVNGNETTEFIKRDLVKLEVKLFKSYAITESARAESRYEWLG